MQKTVLVTGSSSGIGKATCRLFQQKGWQVAATMRNPDNENELNKLENVILFKLDVTDQVSIDRVIKQVIEQFKTIDVVVNNAGYGLVGPFEFSSAQQVETQFATNVFGVMNICRTILPYFRERKQGTLVTVSSMGGKFAVPLYSLYHATKFSVEGFMEALQYELKQFNIRVKLVEPGPVKTDFYGRSAVVLQSELKDYDDFVNRAMPNMAKGGADGATPEEVAKVIYKAATDTSNRLRYSAGLLGTMLIFFRKLLPDILFQYAVEKAVVK